MIEQEKKKGLGEKPMAVELEEYVARLEQQLAFMNRQLTIQGIEIEHLKKELGYAPDATTNGSASSSAQEENAGNGGRPRPDRAVSAG